MFTSLLSRMADEMRADDAATDIPARRTGPVTPMPALPPPRMITSNFSGVIELIPLLAALMRSGRAGDAAWGSYARQVDDVTCS
jgi:hypothetical protein